MEIGSQLNKQLLFAFCLPFSECLVSARHGALHIFIIFLSNSSIIQYHLFQEEFSVKNKSSSKYLEQKVT